MSKNKKTREQKMKKDIHTIKQLDRFVNNTPNNIAASTLHSISSIPHNTNFPMNNIVNKITNNDKYISTNIKKCAIIGSLLFITIIILYIVNLKYNFINPLGKNLFEFLLKR